MELAKCSEEEIISALMKNKIAESDIQSALTKQANTFAITESTVATNSNTASINTNTSAIATNAAATKAQTVAEEDALLAEWMRIGGEESETIATIENTTVIRIRLIR